MSIGFPTFTPTVQRDSSGACPWPQSSTSSRSTPFALDCAQLVLARKNTATAATIMLTFFTERPPTITCGLSWHRLQSVRFSTRAKIKTTQAEACATGTAPDELASNMRKATQNFPEILVGSAVYFSGPPGHCALPPLQSPATCSGSPFPATSTLIPAGSRMDQPYLLSAAGL